MQPSPAATATEYNRYTDTGHRPERAVPATHGGSPPLALSEPSINQLIVHNQ